MVLAFASSFITFAAQKISGAVQPTEIYPLRGRIVNALVSYMEYLEKMVWPRELTVFYPHPWNALAVWKGAAAAIALACVTAAAVKMIRKAPFLAVGWFWFLGTLVPVIGIVQVGWQAMADRFAYIPLIGIFIAIAWGLPDLLAKRCWRNKALAVSAGLIIPVLMAISWTQASLWTNSVVLFKHTVAATDKKYPSFAMAHLTLGNALGKQKMMDEAIAQYEEAIRLIPHYLEPHYNLANILRQQGNYKEAAIHYRKTIKLKPNHAEARNNLGNALSAEGRSQEAIISYQNAIWIKPNYTEAHYNLGRALAHAGRPEEAISQYREAIRLRPNFANAYNNLGSILRKQGNFQEAIANFRAAIKIDHGFTLAYGNLKLALSLAGKSE